VANGRRRRRFLAWWPMEGEGKGSLFGGQWKEKEKVLFYPFPFPLKQLTLNLQFLSFDLKFLLYHGPRPLFTPPLPFLGL
jgi:hypothetical protein